MDAIQPYTRRQVRPGVTRKRHGSTRPGTSMRSTEESLLKRVDCPPKKFQAPNSLHFDVLCNYNLGFHDIPGAASLPAANVNDCMSKCSAYVGDVVCYGIAFQVSKSLCWLKDSTVATTNPEAGENDDTISALVQRSDLTAANTTCEYPDGSVQEAAGEKFKIFCDKDLVTSNYCPGNDPNKCPYHADSLDECLHLCTEASPQCFGVSYNADMKLGYANCWPKQRIPAGYLPDSDVGSGRVTHSAILQIPTVDAACKPDQIITKGGKNYQLNCNENRANNDLDTPFFANSIEDCIAGCAEFKGTDGKECQAVVFDPLQQDAYNNCYLKSSTGVPTAQNSFMTALMTTDSAATSDGTTTSSKGSSSNSSKAWIAGPVLGILALVALIAGFLFWRRRRASRRISPIGISQPRTMTMNSDSQNSFDAYSSQKPSFASPFAGSGGWQPRQVAPTARFDAYYKPSGAAAAAPEELDSTTKPHEMFAPPVFDDKPSELSPQLGKPGMVHPAPGSI